MIAKVQLFYCSDSSLLKCNLSNKIMLTAGSSKFETNSEISN